MDTTHHHFSTDKKSRRSWSTSETVGVGWIFVSIRVSVGRELVTGRLQVTSTSEHLIKNILNKKWLVSSYGYTVTGITSEYSILKYYEFHNTLVPFSPRKHRKSFSSCIKSAESVLPLKICI